MDQFKPGMVVVLHPPACGGGGRPKESVFATIVAGPHHNGTCTYDLDCQRHVPVASLSSISMGDLVEYMSLSMNQWIPARVVRPGRILGTLDLDCKESVPSNRLRLPSMCNAPLQARPFAEQSAPAGCQESLGLTAGEHCLYRSSGHGWIPASVLAWRPRDGVYDLDVKPGARQDCVFCLREGTVVEYQSTSTNQWIPARLLRNGHEEGTFDLDCKPRVSINRLRPPKDPFSTRPHSGADGQIQLCDARNEDHVNGELEHTLVGVSQRSTIQADALSPAVTAGVPSLRSTMQVAGPSQRTTISVNGLGLQSLRSTMPVHGNLAESQRTTIAGDTPLTIEQTFSTDQDLAWQQQQQQANQWILDPQLIDDTLRRLSMEQQQQSQENCTLKDLQQPTSTEKLDSCNVNSLRQAATEDKLEELRQAVVAQDPELLRARLESQSVLRITGDELNHASHELWALETRPMALAELRAAAAGNSAVALHAAIEAAEVVGVSKDEIEAAKCALHGLEAMPWVYAPSDGRHLDIRIGPAVNGPRTQSMLSNGERFLVCCELKDADGILYLKLKDGRGWVFASKPGVGTLCVRRSDASPGDYVITHNETAVTRSCRGAGEADVVARLQFGTRINILEVNQTLPVRGKIRGRIAQPAGWIDLSDLSTGKHWAHRQTNTGFGR